jgi:nickel-type superoxide dismutase maturation protease
MSIDGSHMPERNEAQTYHSRLSGRTAAGVAALAAAVACLLTWWRWRPFRVAVEGDSMEPSFRAGDRLFATRPGRVRPGDVVVAEHPSRPGFELIKRVRYGPGDLSPDGTTLGDDGYWIEGDRPERSTDSRQFGPIRRAGIRGVVRWRYASVRT